MQPLNLKTTDLKKFRWILRNSIIGRRASYTLAGIAAPGLNRLVIRHPDAGYVTDAYRAFIDRLAGALADKTLHFGARRNNAERFVMDSYHRVGLPANILFINRDRKINRQVLVITNNRDFLVCIPDKVLVMTPTWIHAEEYGGLSPELAKKHVLSEHLHGDHNLLERKWKGSREVYSQWRAQLRLKAPSGFEILMTCKSMEVLQPVHERLKAFQDSLDILASGSRFE